MFLLLPSFIGLAYPPNLPLERSFPIPFIFLHESLFSRIFVLYIILNHKTVEQEKAWMEVIGPGLLHFIGKETKT